MSNFSFKSSKFQPKFTPKLLQTSQHFQNNQTDQKIQKDYKTEYKKVKAKLALLEDEEDVSSDDVIVQVKVLMALVEDKQLDVGKNHVRNGILLSMDEDAD
ncbi:hypothetical protein Tco_0904613 [Tanacetum coccineum]